MGCYVFSALLVIWSSSESLIPPYHQNTLVPTYPVNYGPKTVGHVEDASNTTTEVLKRL